MKSDIRKGIWGKPRRLKTLCFWPRDLAYYQRNSWAGNLQDAEGRWILDSPAHNAMAHFLHNLLYLLGDRPDSSAVPARIKAEAYRAFPIQNYDTTACRIWTDKGTELLFYASHAVSRDWGPMFLLDFEEATISFGETGQDIVARDLSGGEKRYGSPDDEDQFKKLFEAIQVVQGRREVVCGPEASRSQVVSVNGIQDSVGAVTDLPLVLLQQSMEGKVMAKAVEQSLTICYQRGVLPSESNQSWAQAGKIIDLTNYIHFPPPLNKQERRIDMSSNSRELVRKTLEFCAPDRIPRQIWLLPWAENRYPEKLRQIQKEFPNDLVSAPALYTQALKVQGERYTRGEYVDEWGCTFTNPQDGIIGIVHNPLIGDWEVLDTFKPPEELLFVDKEGIDRFCRATDQFVLAAHVVRPFERLQFIRTMEQALVDLMEQPSELFELLDRMHAFYCKEVEVWAQTEVDAIALMDDWGTQQALLLHPDIFRQVFKPMYRDYVEIARGYGKYVFMHSDGYITDIIPDLIEVGVDSLNAQIFCMGVEELGRRFKGKITFWGEIDRQYLLPHGTEAEIEAAVRSVWHHLSAPGGVIAQCEFGLEARPENVCAVFKAWDGISTALGGDD